MRMLHHGFRKLLRRSACRFHARKQRAHAAQEQPGFERAQNATDLNPVVLDAPPEFVFCPRDERARDDVGMAVQVFGRRMHDEIGAVFDRAAQHRRGDRGIRRQPRAGCVRNLRHRGNIGDVPHGIAGCLDPHEFGAIRAHGPPNGIQIAHIGEIDTNPPGVRKSGDPVAQRPVHHLRRHHVIAGRECLEHARCGRHAGGEHQRIRPVFQRCEHRLRLIEGRIVAARIIAPRAIEIILVAQEGARQMQRRRDGPCLLIHPTECLRRQGGGLRVCFVHQCHAVAPTYWDLFRPGSH